MTDHAFRRADGKLNLPCEECGQLGGAAIHLMPLPGLEDVHQTREQAKAEQTGEELTAILRTRGKDVSRLAGDMERDAPLFHGTGDNPTLF